MIVKLSAEVEQDSALPDRGALHAYSTEAAEGGGFQVHLDNFNGPFDLLLQLISRHKLDITEVALSQVTDEFIAHIKAAGSAWDLDQTSHFVVVAATLLDLKAARLIPSGEVEDPEDLALLEARDLLFARLLQYRAFQRVASYIATTLQAQGRRFPRDVGIEPRFARLLPELTMTISPARLAALAAKAMAPKQASVLSLAHMHAPAVSVREQATVRRGSATAPADHDLSGADQRLIHHVGHGGTIPRAAGVVPRRGRSVRAADSAGRAHRPMDRRRGGRLDDLRRIR